MRPRDSGNASQFHTNGLYGMEECDPSCPEQKRVVKRGQNVSDSEEDCSVQTSALSLGLLLYNYLAAGAATRLTILILP
jgi:hypothetical protein